MSKQWKENSHSLRNQLTVGTPPLLSLWNDIWGMSAAEIPSDDSSLLRSRVLNKSRQSAKFAGYFTWTGRLLFFRNFRQKSQNLVMSVLCSNSLIFAPECWKCTLREALGTPSNFFVLHLLQSFYRLLRTKLKTVKIWVVLLISWSKFPSQYDQWEALPRSG